MRFRYKCQGASSSALGTSFSTLAGISTGCRLKVPNHPKNFSRPPNLSCPSSSDLGLPPSSGTVGCGASVLDAACFGLFRRCCQTQNTILPTISSTATTMPTAIPAIAAVERPLPPPDDDGASLCGVLLRRVGSPVVAAEFGATELEPEVGEVPTCEFTLGGLLSVGRAVGCVTDELCTALTLAGSRVPHLSLMLVVQSDWACALPEVCERHC